MKLKSTAKYFILLILSIILTFLIAELILRSFIPFFPANPMPQNRYDEELGIISKPNFKKTIVTDHVVERYTNDIGIRNYLSKIDLMKYDKIIFCVGDSFTEGVGVETDETYPFYLDLILNGKGNSYKRRFAVFNLGFSTYGSILSYICTKKFIKEMNKMPDIIIYFICSNDFSDDLCFGTNYHRYHLVSGNPHIHPVILFLNNLFQHSQIYLRFRFLMYRIFMPQFKEETFTPAQLVGLKKLINFTKENNIQLIISYTDYESPNYDLFKKFAAENNILFSDYKNDLLSIASNIDNIPIFNQHSGGHYRPWANFLISKHFAVLIERIGDL